MTNTIAIPVWMGGRVVGHSKVDARFHWLRQWRWRLSAHGYVMRGERVNGHFGNVWMHRVVTGCFSWLEIDHINRDKTDNRLANLRMVAHAENMRNKAKYANNTSGCVGVSFVKDKKKWYAYVNKDGVRTSLGFFGSKEEAASVATRARTEMGFVNVAP